MLTPSSRGNQKASARAAGAPRRAVGTAALPPLRAARLLDQVRERVRGLHYSLRTEEAYVFWCRDFVRFHGLRHPVEMGGPEVEAFLTHLAAQRGLSVSSHRQEVAAVPAELDGVHGLLARRLYGTGLRIEEALRLRVKDLDFAHQAIFVRSGKGKDRVVMLRASLGAKGGGASGGGGQRPRRTRAGPRRRFFRPWPPGSCRCGPAIRAGRSGARWCRWSPRPR
jgi:integrase